MKNSREDEPRIQEEHKEMVSLSSTAACKQITPSVWAQDCIPDLDYSKFGESVQLNKQQDGPCSLAGEMDAHGARLDIDMLVILARHH